MSALPTLTGLRAFESAARLGSFTAAAVELNVTQAAVSRSVKALEQQLGWRLFTREANALALTPQGTALLPDISQAFSLMEQSLRRAREAQAAPVLTVGVGPTFAIKWLIPRLGRFHAAHPQIEVRTVTGGATAQLRPDWTCSLRLGRDPTPGTVSTPMFSPLMTPVCTPALARRLKSAADLRRVPLLDVGHTPEDWTLWLQEAGVDATQVDRKSVFPFHAFALQAALDGQGVAMGLRPYVIDDLSAGRLVAPFSLEVVKPQGWFFVQRRDDSSHRALAPFRAWVLREARADAKADAHVARASRS